MIAGKRGGIRRGTLRGRLSRGAAAAMMVRKPMIRPDPPAPAIARPMMNIVDVLASAQTKEPISKMAKPSKKVYWGIVRGSLGLRWRVHDLPSSHSIGKTFP